MIERWFVVRSKKIIVSSAEGIPENDARIYADRWNTLFRGADYEAISSEEATKRHARPVKWEDSIG